MSKAPKPVVATAPCLRCGHELQWKQDTRGCAYAFCPADDGGCGAKVTLGRADTQLFLEQQKQPAPAPQPQPKEDDDDKEGRTGTGRPKLWFEW